MRRNVILHPSTTGKLWTEITNPKNYQLVNFGLKRW